MLIQKLHSIFSQVLIWGIPNGKMIKFVLDFLREKQALLVHGSGFGKEYGSDHFRLVYLANPEYLNEGLDRLSDFLKWYNRYII